MNIPYQHFYIKILQRLIFTVNLSMKPVARKKLCKIGWQLLNIAESGIIKISMHVMNSKILKS